MNDLDKLITEAYNLYSKKNFTDAAKIYLKLSNEGHVDSQIFYGWMLFNGEGVVSNPEKAAKLFEKAALLGSIKGAYYFGSFLRASGKYDKAFTWYLSAANKGDIPSKFRVGYSFSRGLGVKVNIQKAYRYLSEASESGHVFALREISLLDISGNRGFKKRLYGLLGFVYSLSFGIVLAFVNKSSFKLRT